MKKMYLNAFAIVVALFFSLMSCDGKKPETPISPNSNTPTSKQFGNLSSLDNPVKWKYAAKSVSATEVDLVFTATIERSWHLYGNYFEDGGPVKMSFTFDPSANYEVVGKIIESPSPTSKYDSLFGINVQYFHKTATFTQRIKIRADKPFTLTGEVSGQACSDDDGKCVLVGTPFKFDLQGVAKQTTTTPTTTNTTTSDTLKPATIPQLPDSIKTPTEDSLPIKTTPNTIETDTSDTTVSSDMYDLKNKSLWWLFGVSFLAGLLAIFTPCVFPMIPMTVSFFMHGNKNKAKARFEALVYGVSIIGIYTLVGTIVAITLGANFANWLSTHWLPNVLFFVIFMIFAASFLGMFEITMPSWMVNKADRQADKGGVLGAFFMAFTLVLVSFSCTGPLVGAILVKSAGGAVIEPVIGMLGFSLAFALPFSIFAFFPQLMKGLPKSGGWLNSVKVVLGFIELALGLKFLSVADQTYHWSILDREIYLALWIVIFALMGFYLLGKLKFSHDSDLAYISVPRLSLAIITFAFVVYMIPGMWGAPLKMLSGYLPPETSQDFDLTQISRNNAAHSAGNDDKQLCDKPKYADFLHLPHGLQGYFDYEQALQCAKQQNKPIFIDFTGHGCVNCRKMEANVWSDNRVLDILRNDYIIVALYVDDKTDLPESEWFVSSHDGRTKRTIGHKYADFQISRFGVNAQPYYVLLDTNGNLLVQPRAYDLDVDKFIDFLKSGVQKFKNNSK